MLTPTSTYHQHIMELLHGIYFGFNGLFSSPRIVLYTTATIFTARSRAISATGYTVA